MKSHFIFYFLSLFLLFSCRMVKTLPAEHTTDEQLSSHTIAVNAPSNPASIYGMTEANSVSVAFDSVMFQRNLYEDAFASIRSMLEGRRTTSFRQAVFSVENAYAKGQLDYNLYNKQLTELHTLSKLYAKAHTAEFDYTFTDRDTILQHAGLFAAMKDTLILDFDSLQLVHFPMTYNVTDFNGEQHWESTFVSSLLQTGKGNCQSLAYLYNILAEMADVESHLALAPNHIYIKRSSRKTGMYNTELTNGTFPVDAWIMASGYVNLQAIQNGLYMQPLNEEEELALCLLDLAKGYEKTYGIGNGAFVLRCCNTALAYFPNCVSAKLLKEKVLGEQAKHSMAIAVEHQRLVAELYKSGYRNMPEEQYLGWLSGNAATQHSTAVNYQPFGSFESKNDPTRTAALSKGHYQEFFVVDTLATIGRTVLDTRTLAVVGYEKATPFTLDPETAYRFFAIDPLAAKYPHNSPYAFSENRVIDGIELEGLEWIPIQLINNIIANEAAIKKQDASSTTSGLLWMVHFVRGAYNSTPQGQLEGLTEYLGFVWEDSQKLAKGEMTVAEWHERHGGQMDAKMLQGMTMTFIKAVTTGDAEAVGEAVGIATQMFAMYKALPNFEVNPKIASNSFTATANRTTTILGRLADTRPLGENLVNVRSGKNNGGFNILYMPDKYYSWANNKKWLQRAIRRNDIIKAASDPTDINNIWKNGIEGGERTIFGKEVEVLEGAGYKYNPENQTFTRQN